MTTCLVTGASGLLGPEVIRALNPHFGRVVGLSRREHGDHLRRIDLRDPEAFTALLQELKPDAVVHLAAYREPDLCEEQPEETRRLNVHPIGLCTRVLPPGTRQLLVSTDYVFDGNHPPYAEEATRHPISCYGRSKFEAEDILFGRPGATVLRVPLLIGAGSSWTESGFIAQMVDAVRSGRETLLDDVLLRFPCWTRDVGGAIAFLLQGHHDGVFHLSGPRGATRYAWTVEVARALGHPAEHLQPSHEVVPRRAARPFNSQLADTRLRGLGYATATDPMEVVRQVVDVFQRSPST